MFFLAIYLLVLGTCSNHCYHVLSFTFVLDPKAKMRGFYNILQHLSQTIGVDYSSYFSEVRTELYKLYNKYENKFGV
jgi:hypothetical protein